MSTTSPPAPQQQQQQDVIGLIDEYIEIWDNMGLDFNGIPPSTLYAPVKEGCGYDPQFEMGRLEFVVDKINAQVKKHGERYVLKEAVRIVDAHEVHFGILKFNVREVNTSVFKTVEAFVFEGSGRPELTEWRFKDGPPEIPPPGFPSPEIAPLGTPCPNIPGPAHSSPDSDSRLSYLSSPERSPSRTLPLEDLQLCSDDEFSYVEF